MDGKPKPGLSIGHIDLRDAESVEVYGGAGDLSGTLSREWPRNAPCGDTGMPQTFARASSVITWVVVWRQR